MRAWVVSAVMLMGAYGLWMSSGIHREAPLVEHRGMTAGVVAMENEVALAPDDAQKLSSLCQAYLQRNAPGLSLAAIHRAPSMVQQQPEIQHLWAKALLYEGQASEALDKQRFVLAACEKQECSAWLVASAARQEAFLSALVDGGVEDVFRNPGQAFEAYRLVSGPMVTVMDSERQTVQ